MTPKEILKQADRAFKSKDYNLANELYKRILIRVPNHTTAKNKLQKIKKLTKDNTPEIEKVKVNVIITALKNGNYKRAIDLATSLITEDPLNPLLQNIIGISHINLGNPKNAIPYFKKALNLKNNYNEARANLGSALLLLGHADEAIVELNQSLIENPKNSKAWHSLGNAKRNKLLYVEAQLAFEKALELNPNYINALNSLGVLLSKSGKEDQAIKIFKKGLKLDPEDSSLLTSYGFALSEVGEIEKAEKLIRKAIAIDPNLSEAYRSLSIIHRFEKSDPLIIDMKKKLQTVTANIYDKIHIGFALGKGMHDLGEYSMAFSAYEIANKARRSELLYDSKENSNSIEHIKTKYSNKNQIISIKNNPKDINPIFIVGMNRSGTTLVEQILSSHSSVTGAGELPYINKVGLDSLKNNISWTKTELSHAYQEYSKVLNGFAQNTKFVTDKAPVNFKWIGLIKNIFPDAKIVHLIRDPMDTCLSNYRNYFQSPGIKYAYDQVELAKFFTDYRNIMEFWYNLFPDQIYTCDYNLLTLNQEREMRALLNYCELSWEPGVLKFEESTRIVKTASVAQVREGIYRTSIGSWKKYEKYLDPMYNTLKDGKAFKPWVVKSFNNIRS